MHLPRLRDLREDEELSQQKIADYLNMHRSVYRRYESGEREIPVWALVKLADYYHTSLDYLAGRTNEWKHYQVKSRLIDCLALGDVVKFIEFYWDQGISSYFSGLTLDQWRDGFNILKRARNALAHNHEDYLQESDIRATEMFCRRLAEVLN